MATIYMVVTDTENGGLKIEIVGARRITKFNEKILSAAELFANNMAKASNEFKDVVEVIWEVGDINKEKLS